MLSQYISLFNVKAVMLSFLLLLASAGLAQASGGSAQSPQEEGPTVVDLTLEPGREEAAPADHTKDKQRYAVELDGYNIRLFIRVNDVPVYFKVIRHRRELDIPFNEWLKSGLNIVKISAEKFDEKSSSDLNYSIYFQSPSQIVANQRHIMYSSPPELNLPVRKPTGFVIRTMPSLRIWQTEEIYFTREEKSRLIDMINGFRARLVEAVGRADDAFLATYDKNIREEILKAYGRPPEKEEEVIERRRELAKTFRKEINEKLIATKPLEASDLDFESIGGGKMVRVARLDGAPLIEVKRGSLEFVINKPIYGRIGGVWELLRDRTTQQLD